MKVKLMGKSNFKSKEGKELYTVGIAYQNERVEGLAVGTYFCNKDFYDACTTPLIGKEIECSVSFKYNSISFPVEVKPIV